MNLLRQKKFCESYTTFVVSKYLAMRQASKLWVYARRSGLVSCNAVSCVCVCADVRTVFDIE